MKSRIPKLLDLDAATVGQIDKLFFPAAGT